MKINNYIYTSGLVLGLFFIPITILKNNKT